MLAALKHEKLHTIRIEKDDWMGAIMTVATSQ